MNISKMEINCSLFKHQKTQALLLGKQIQDPLLRNTILSMRRRRCSPLVGCLGRSPGIVIWSLLLGGLPSGSSFCGKPCFSGYMNVVPSKTEDRWLLLIRLALVRRRVRLVRLNSKQDWLLRGASIAVLAT